MTARERDLADALRSLLRLYQLTGDHTAKRLGAHGSDSDCVACEAHRALEACNDG